MSNILSKLFTGFLILVVIVAVITAVRDDLLSGGASYDLFVAMFDSFPFAKELAEVAANIGKFQVTLRGLSPANILDDLTKVFAMAVVCPMVGSIACSIFLPVPNYSDWYDREKYMNGLGYRLKEAGLNMIIMPICALLTAVLVSKLHVWIQGQLPFLNPNVVSIVVLTVMFTASVLIQGVERPNQMGLILRHRLITDLLGGVLKIVGMNFLCFFIALALLNDRGNVALGCIVTLMIYLAALDLMIQSVMGIFS